jgi:hypothetical protein
MSWGGIWLRLAGCFALRDAGNRGDPFLGTSAFVSFTGKGIVVVFPLLLFALGRRDVYFTPDSWSSC